MNAKESLPGTAPVRLSKLMGSFRYALLFFLFYMLCGIFSLGAWELTRTINKQKISDDVFLWECRVDDGTGVEVTVTGVEFSEKTHTLQVADFAPPVKKRLASIADSAGALAGCNASYFHSDYKPLGLVAANGKVINKQENSRLLSGVIAIYRDRIEIVRAKAFQSSKELRAAVQAGPWLVERGESVTGLEALKRARRTVFARGSNGKCYMLATSPITLTSVSDLLASGVAIPDGKITSALNLDGGSSTALWARTSPAVSIPEFGHVRNFLLLFKKK